LTKRVVKIYPDTFFTPSQILTKKIMTWGFKSNSPNRFPSTPPRGYYPPPHPLLENSYKHHF